MTLVHGKRVRQNRLKYHGIKMRGNMVKKNKTVNKYFRFGVIVFLVFLILGVWVFRYLKILPYTRRLFISYSSFYEKAAADTFHAYPNELPSSAKDIRYFYYTGSLDKMTEVSCIVNEEEYQELKETYQIIYTAKAERYKKKFKQEQEDYQMKRRTYEPTELYHYVFNGTVTSEFLETEHLDYLGKTMHGEFGNYSILVYCRVNQGGTMFGVLSNDENHEIIFFNFQDAGKNGRPGNKN